MTSGVYELLLHFAQVFLLVPGVLWQGGSAGGGQSFLSHIQLHGSSQHRAGGTACWARALSAGNQRRATCHPLVVSQSKHTMWLGCKKGPFLLTFCSATGICWKSGESLAMLALAISTQSEIYLETPAVLPPAKSRVFSTKTSRDFNRGWA